MEKYSNENLIIHLEDLVSQLKTGDAGIISCEVSFIYPEPAVVFRELKLKYQLKD